MVKLIVCAAAYPSAQLYGHPWPHIIQCMPRIIQRLIQRALGMALYNVLCVISQALQQAFKKQPATATLKLLTVRIATKISNATGVVQIFLTVNHLVAVAATFGLVICIALRLCRLVTAAGPVGQMAVPVLPSD